MKEQNFFPAAQDPDAAHRYLRWMCTYRIFYPFCLLYIDTAQGSRLNYKKVNYTVNDNNYNLYKHIEPKGEKYDIRIQLTAYNVQVV